MEKLCRTYWYALYAYVRRQGRGPEDAQDLVQSFFARCLEKNYFHAADAAKGRFRSFLLVALKRFLANEWDRERARKRGGPQRPIALDALTAEQRYALEPSDHLSADKLFERRWALALLERVLARLGDEQTAAGRAAMFAQMKDCLTAAERTTRYSELAARLGTTEGAVKIAMHRLRQRYRHLLLDEIAQTVATPEEAEAERRYLLAVISQ
jgi:RNA polymerase sigma-70 factor (ECF subfamily)